MYKMDKMIGKGMSFKEVEEQKPFPKETTMSERLKQACYLICMAYEIDPSNLPKMDKSISSSRKHLL